MRRISGDKNLDKNKAAEISANFVNKAREAILALKPVTFRYKPEIDPEKVPQFGLVAEQVEKVNPDLVVHDHNRKPFTVR